MNMEVILLGASQYNFKDDNGRELKGTTVHYIANNVNEEGKKGYFPNKVTLPFEYFSMLSRLDFPQNASASVEIDLGNKKNQLKITGFTPNKKVAL